MKKKNDDLLRLAFGELTADAARAVEAQASSDASAQRELEAYRDLRASLQHLPPPPPDGLSTERLRAAILDRELSAKRTPSFSWAWAPMALAAFVGFVILSRSGTQGGSQTVVMNEPVSEVGAETFRVSPLASYDGRLEKSVVKAVVPPPVEKAQLRGESVEQDFAKRSIAPGGTVNAPASRNRSALRNQVSNSIAADFAPRPMEAQAKEARTVSFGPHEPQVLSVPVSIVTSPGTRSAMNSDDTVIIVSAKRDLETGAPAATEMEASNVLVGG